MVVVVAVVLVWFGDPCGAEWFVPLIPVEQSNPMTRFNRTICVCVDVCDTQRRLESFQWRKKEGRRRPTRNTHHLWLVDSRMDPAACSIRYDVWVERKEIRRGVAYEL